MDHGHFIKRCLELAGRGRGRVGTNPLVGAVLVRDGNVVGEGWHEGCGMAHAECMLLGSLEGPQALPHSMLYLNLEPCCHYGRTPPCTDLIIEKGIKRVVYGMIDPDPRVAGNGVEALRMAGVEVIGPVLPELCQRFNRGYVSLWTNNRPWITLKRAQTRDGRIANDGGSPLKITSKEQDIWSHTWLRATHDAILVGVQTLINDDPTLDARLSLNKNDAVPCGDERSSSASGAQFHPLRIVLDPHLRIPLQAKVVSDARATFTLVVAAEGKGDVQAKEELQKRGVAVLEIPMVGDCFEWNALWKALTYNPLPRVEGIASLLVEGGKRTWEGFEQAGFVDEEVVLVGL